MRSKSRKSSNAGAKLAGVLAVTALSGTLLYRRFKPNLVSPLPKALDSDQVCISIQPVGALSYYVDRHSEGRPLVLIHSINAAPSSIEMKPLFDHYRGTRPVYALDLPGFGFSERSADRTYSPTLYAQAIIALLEREVGEAADVIALSLGCEFAARAAWLRPELFNSLAMISPTGLNARPIDLPGELLYPVFSFPLWSQPAFELLTTRPSIRYYLNKNFVGEAPDILVDYAYATSHQPNARVAPFYFLSGQLFSPDICPAVYEKLSVPTMILYDRDPNISFDKLPDLLASNDLCQARRLVPSLGLPHWELLSETTATLDEFWVTAQEKNLSAPAAG